MSNYISASETTHSSRKFISNGIKTVLRGLLPHSAYKWVARHAYPLYCPICEQGYSHFKAFGDPPRQNALCGCGALERHRMILLFFQRETNLFDGRAKRVLHVAPEVCLVPRMRSANLDYVSGDNEPGRAMVQLDITNIEFPDEHFDVIYCSHVLEHVPEDRRAMQEFFRVLRPGGWAVLQVPIRGEETYEDLAIESPYERKVHFGQEDHVRWYGAADYARRLRESGFRVEQIRYARKIPQREVIKYGLDETELIHFCRK